MTNKWAFIVSEYLTKKMLSKIGYNFSYDELECWEVEAYNIIANTIANEEEKAIKKSQGKHGK
jgi:hemoglobin-like flavoprotein